MIDLEAQGFKYQIFSVVAQLPYTITYDKKITDNGMKELIEKVKEYVGESKWASIPLTCSQEPYKTTITLYDGHWIRKAEGCNFACASWQVKYDIAVFYKPAYSTASDKPLGDLKMAGSDNFKGKKIGQSKLGGTKFRAPTKSETTGKMSAGKKKK